MQNKIILTLLFSVVFLSVLSFYISHFTSPIVVQELRRLELKVGNIQSEFAKLSSKIPYYIYAGDSQGYVIDFSNEVSFYFTGDTGLSSDIELIGDYYKPEALFLPIGNIYTMDFSSAAFAANLINPQSYIIPTHYGSLIELEENTDSFYEELEKYNLEEKFLEFNIEEEKDLMGIKTKWLGHNHWFFEDSNGCRILIDPEFSYNPSFPSDCMDLSCIKEVDVVLITNAHPDSISISDIQRIGNKFDPVFITPYELGIWLKSKLPEYKFVATDQGARLSQKELSKMGIKGDSLEKIGDIVINVVPASHSSSLFQEDFQEDK
jgi:L-ascorbate metabolism protein UlaG (beta-lactamase superfamily)